jgi:glutamine synthetase type III
MRQLKQYKLKLDSKEKIEELLQEIYAEACKNIEEAQNEINKITHSTDLGTEIIDGKAKYAKAINDFIATKDKAIARKFEIAKLMTEVIKFNGNIQQAFTEGDVPGNWDDIVLNTPPEGNNNGPIEYTLK